MKRKPICILVSLLVLLSGAAFAQEDPVLFTFESREVRQSEVVRRTTAYAQAGLISSEKAYMEAIQYMIRNQLVPEAKAAELGLDQFTQEELDSIRAEADAYYEQQLDAYIAYFAADMSKEDQAAFRQELREYWAEMGTTPESAEETHLFNRIRARLLDAMEITVTEEEILQVFQEQAAKDEAYFKDNYRAYEYYTHYRGYSVWYVPEGYREVLDLCFAAKTKDPLAENREAIDAVLALLNAGQAFETLTAPDGTTPSVILVHDNSTLYGDQLVEIVFSDAMREKGAVSEPFADENGAHILCTVGDVPSGAVALDGAIRESITNHLTSRKQDEILDEWTSEYRIEYNLPAIEALYTGA